MCYHYNPAHLSRLQKLYPDKFGDKEFDVANGFAHPHLPVVTNQDAGLMKWGLVPLWVNDDVTATRLSKMCLNAKIETIAEKPAFRDALQNNQRCIIPARAFYEWRWEDEKGKQKTKFEIVHTDTDLFYFGGLYSHWTNKVDGKSEATYTIITCPANEVMTHIHNIKKRMPTILTNETADGWLEGALTTDDLIHISQAQKIEGHILDN